MLEKILKPFIDDAYNKGFTAGINAEKLVKEQQNSEREYDLFRRGVEFGKEEILKEMEEDIVEINPTEFQQLVREPFGFTGPLEDLKLVLNNEIN